MTERNKLTFDDLKIMMDKIEATRPDESEVLNKLTEIFGELDEMAGEKLKEYGMPKHIYVGSKYYETFSLYLSPYCNVVRLPENIQELYPDQVFLSWVDHSSWSALKTINGGAS